VIYIILKNIDNLDEYKKYKFVIFVEFTKDNKPYNLILWMNETPEEFNNKLIS
jgi:hypothetical protein